MSNDAIAQKAIRGTVLDEANEPIIGASVLVKGTTNGSITGVDGTFNVKANPSDILIISYVGYATVEQQIGNQTQFVIHLREDSKVLNDVVVIGYGSTTKKELTGSVTSMKKDDLNPGTFTNAMGILQGKVAGLQIINPNGADPTAKYEVLLRGTNTLSAGQGPLIIIDGVVGADIRNINFQEVESVDVLKDGSAAAIYGTRGTNGVIIVTTKRARSGKTEVSYDGQFTVGTVSRRAKLYRQMNTSLLSRNIVLN
ncbi:putative outer membrane protein [Bacteroides pyogenes JCM 6292]|nr:putative outer membrane protein [Bacteroides pyogenes JCM 6292]